MTAGQAPACVSVWTPVLLADQADRAGLLCDADILRFGEESQRLFAAFAADAALFHAAEGDAQVAHQPAVYPDCAGMNFLRDAMGPTQVLCPDTRSQAVLRVVSVPDHFFFVVERRYGDNRAEDFFTVRAAGDW